jgi:hypothetical protein
MQRQLNKYSDKTICWTTRESGTLSGEGFLSTQQQPRPGPTQPPIQRGAEILFPGNKATEDRSWLPPRAKEILQPEKLNSVT